MSNQVWKQNMKGKKFQTVDFLTSMHSRLPKQITDELSVHEDVVEVPSFLPSQLLSVGNRSVE